MRETGEAGKRGMLLATVAVAATYFYFLLFAEFALLEMVGGTGPEARFTMGALALGGLLGGAGAAWRFRADRFAASLGLSLLAGGGLAATAPLWTASPLAAAGAACVGLSLGGATVTLASGLRLLVPVGRLGFAIGLGTGSAYALANVPPLFSAHAAVQCWVAGLGAAMGGLACLDSSLKGAAMEGNAAVLRTRKEPAPSREGFGRIAAVATIVLFFALVWVDSAAFFIIQHTAELRGVSWEGGRALWGNAGMHLVAALVAGLALDRGHARLLLAAAFAGLAAACLAIQGPEGGRESARWAYTAGVSLYSTALVWFAARSGSPRFVAVLFGLSGWLASGLGIGMVQDLSRIPDLFLVASGCAVAVALVLLGSGSRRTAAAACAAAAALVWPERIRAAVPEAEGRAVYLAEGCIECHSQYIRRAVRGEVLAWGPAQAGPAAPAADAPPLYGNRRLGPDLGAVGLRRSPEWNRLHLIDPRAVTPGSRMPSYARLFADGDTRGEALVAYLASLGAGREGERSRLVADWRPDAFDADSGGVAKDDGSRGDDRLTAVIGGDPVRGRALWTALCTGCHGPDGRGDGPVAGRLSVRPPDFSRDAWRRLRAANPSDPASGVSALELMRLIKFGVAGTPMAGHEYLSDRDVRALAAWVTRLHAPARP